MRLCRLDEGARQGGQVDTLRAVVTDKPAAGALPEAVLCSCPLAAAWRGECLGFLEDLTGSPSSELTPSYSFPLSCLLFALCSGSPDGRR